MPRGFRILNGTSMSLPPEILLRTFGTEVGDHVHDGNVDTQLRLCFSRIILRGIAPSIEELSPYLFDRIQHHIEVYRSIIRPIMQHDARVYHHTPFQVQADPNPWCVLEYAAPDRSAAVAVVFRTSGATAPFGDAYIFRPRGLHPVKRYTVTLDNDGLAYQTTGIDLAAQGVPVRLQNVLASELLLFEEAP